MKILGVDDDMMARSMLSEALNLSGYSEVMLANSGTDALRKIQMSEVPFDCFLLDIQMDDMDGIQLCRKIRQMPNYAETPIVMVTGLSKKQHMELAFEVGATDYVTKPFDMLELGTRVRIASKISTKVKKIAHDESEIASLKRLVETLETKRENPSAEITAGGFLTQEMFENSLQRLTRPELAHCALVNCHIAHFEHISELCTGIGLESLLSNVATAVGNVFQEKDFVATCGEQGEFVILFRYAAPSNQELVQVQENLNQIRLTSDSGFDGFVLLNFDEPLLLNQISAQGRFGTVEDEKVDINSGQQALDRVTSTSHDPEPRETPQQKLERRLIRMVPHYLTVLNETLARLDILHQNLGEKTGTWDNVDEIERTAHKIAGVAPSLGFSELGFVAANTEKLAAAAPGSKNLTMSCELIEESLGTLLDSIEDTIVENFERRDGEHTAEI